MRSMKRKKIEKRCSSLGGKKKKDGNKQMSPNLIQLKRISFRNKMIGGENIKHPHISQVRKVSKLN